MVGGKNETTKGKYYKIIKFENDKFYILDDSNNSHSFTFKRYKKWFNSIKYERKEKLKKIQNIQFLK